jgi:hypothetical protein
MNEQLQQALLAILTQTVDAVKAGTTFLMAQLPDVIQQLLIWKATQSAIWCGFWLLMSVIILLIIRHYWKPREYYDGYWDTLGPFGIFPFIFCLNFAMIAMTNYEWLQILIAPKIYLIEYAASLVKK